MVLQERCVGALSTMMRGARAAVREPEIEQKNNRNARQRGDMLWIYDSSVGVLQETVEKLAKVVFGVNLLLKYHLQHGVPEIQVRVVGVLLDGEAVAADPTEALEGSKALDVRLHVGVVVRRGGGVG
ncbi:hypothetical protein RJ639_023111 [Escallonia herrerae]|uniref:Uncharacterized protein n=1 Tax=Escallonia herrerae TaxID=1293975 RepID=A0AA89ADJ9_9ASTE|nr:hypothetical protein RJ639_023111 [Escallonia herrerae]